MRAAQRAGGDLGRAGAGPKRWDIIIPGYSRRARFGCGTGVRPFWYNRAANKPDAHKHRSATRGASTPIYMPDDTTRRAGLDDDCRARGIRQLPGPPGRRMKTI